LNNYNIRRVHKPAFFYLRILILRNYHLIKLLIASAGIQLKHMEKNWVCIYSTTFTYQAEIIKDLLDTNDIDAVIINKQDSTYLFGTLEIYVERDNTIRSKHLLNNVDLNTLKAK
jgi:hypothetical protein